VEDIKIIDGNRNGISELGVELYIGTCSFVHRFSLCATRFSLHAERTLAICV